MRISRLARTSDQKIQNPDGFQPLFTRWNFYTDGVCRGNGRSEAIGSAAAVLKQRNERNVIWTKLLPSYPSPTNQRAEFTAIILAVEHALEKFKELHVKVKSDSRYVIGCNEVANRYLLEEAYYLNCRIKKGYVKYIWIPRGEINLQIGSWSDHLEGRRG
ncbi:uncharacterized protein BDW70DRAFT_170006 [Aspergillus foveolatus]|uniref:uncharacterized protein n=1 Tax=Aspergillus foveolatus TaxID=210207 RepID=UPI003CCD3D2C